MKRIQKRHALIIFAGLAFSCGANAALVGEIVEFGYYEVQSEGESFADPNATSGVIQAGPQVKLLMQTNTIPLEKGRLFGFRFRINGFKSDQDVVVREVVTHPPITKPDGKKSTGYETQVPLNVRRGEVIDYAGYRMDHDYELVEGDWHFEFWYEDKKLIDKKFTSLKPENIKQPEVRPAEAPNTAPPKETKPTPPKARVNSPQAPAAAPPQPAPVP